MSSSETFLSYRHFRWLWINIGLTIGALVWYLRDHPLGGKSGGTFYGYTVGIYCALIIVYLTWYGARKRSYGKSTGTLKGVLSSHVWFGIALLVLVPLHCGFEFGFNVHTLAYVLMVLVILSGIWGAAVYIQLAPEIRSHRGQGSMTQLVAGFKEADRLIVLKKEESSDSVKDLVARFDFTFAPTLRQALFGVHPEEIDPVRFSPLLAALTSEDQVKALSFVPLLDKKRRGARRILEEMSVLAKIKFWLYVHVPLTCALLVALAIHIIAVLYY